MPRHRFQHPEDASEQLERAAACHERLFGRRPVGLWPSEGSVSDAMIPLVANAGFEWMATDEQILARTLGINFNRDDSAQVDQPRRLYAPYRLASGDRQVAIAFRDHALSDMRVSMRGGSGRCREDAPRRANRPPSADRTW